MGVKIISPAQTSTEGVKARTKSATSYPYFDLLDSIAVAKAIRDNGGGSCEPDQLAHWLGYKSTSSGTYLTRVAAAKQFGLVAGQGDRLIVTDRALTIIAPVMPGDEARTKGEAFLAVQLFSRVFADFRGRMLPPAVGLANLFQNTYGIVPDRVQQALRVFLASAEQAGFLVNSGDGQRLIQPTSAASSQPQQEVGEEAASGRTSPESSMPDRPKTGGSGGGGSDGPTGVHSAIIGLLRDLPLPGTMWPPKSKKRFLAAFQATIDHIYPDEDEMP